MPGRFRQGGGFPSLALSLVSLRGSGHPSRFCQMKSSTDGLEAPVESKKVVTVYLDIEAQLALTATAQRMDRSKSWVTREALKAFATNSSY